MREPFLLKNKVAKNTSIQGEVRKLQKGVLRKKVAKVEISRERDCDDDAVKIKVGGGGLERASSASSAWWSLDT